MKTVSPSLRKLLVFAATMLGGCVDETPSSPDRPAAITRQFAKQANAEAEITTLRQVTARYHQLEAAEADGFVLLHPCEERGDEGPVGTVYVHIGRLLDGVIDPALPDALIYEPSKNGREKLVGVEFAIPYGLWTEPTPPAFLGATFQDEEEFGVFALHVWVWRNNPNGMFEETNPLVSCAAE
jgi:hypothetical protein